MSHLSYLSTLGAQNYSNGSTKIWRSGENRERERVRKRDREQESLPTGKFIALWSLSCKSQRQVPRSFKLKSGFNKGGKRLYQEHPLGVSWNQSTMVWVSGALGDRAFRTLTLSLLFLLLTAFPSLSLPRWAPELPNTPLFPLLERS